MEEVWAANYKAYREAVEQGTNTKRERNTSSIPLDDLQEQIREQLALHGTNVQMNDDDPTGDGDQSPLTLNDRPFYQELFATGSDIWAYMNAKPPRISTFGFYCIMGETEMVRHMLRQANRPGMPPKALIDLLETRETSLRCSPLLMILSMGKTKPECHEGQLKNVELLLSYGARPEVRDVSGKTVCHYGSGAKATEVSLDIVDRCILAAESSFLFAKEVELFGLSKQSMNGMTGIARGFQVESGRRAVYLLAEKKQVAIKPQNLRLLGNQQKILHAIKLCDVTDRVRTGCLHEVIMTDRIDVARFLIEKHKAAIDIKDLDGFSPLDMATAGTHILRTKSGQMLRAASINHARRILKRLCSQCGTEASKDQIFPHCMRCKVPRYCSKECQTTHWKDVHKRECKEIRADQEKGIVLEHTGVATEPIKNQKRSRQTNGQYRKPKGVAPGEKFYVKVQAAVTNSFIGVHGRILIYDKTRQCTFYVEPGKSGHRELHDVVRAEKASNGIKSFMLASFDERGVCTIFPGTRTIKKW